MKKQEPVIYGHAWAKLPVECLLSDKCNDGHHKGCKSVQRECLCHERVPKSPKEPLEKKPTFSEVYGEIEIKAGPLR